ncbi:putative mannitol dehydrogenase [Phytophthora citrophthora]|uniref:Mannitol dehydrogenase n=1 Tax=Phytophthora citrophthora TaxID=4793 RepID=A0AAD9GXI9_9STRA|nr:putative mannitol dehydrogenase [Phytophthora citrophthora]
MPQIFDRVLPHPTVGEIRASTRGNFPPVFGVESGKGTRFFPNLKRDDWIDVLCPTTSVNPHPLKELGCPQAWIHKTLSEYVSLRRCLLPVVHDVMLRMVFGDLILGSRLCFLKTLSPTVQQCVRESCTATETVEHCFLSCPALEEMWRSLWVPWSEIFSVALDWRLLLFTKPSDLKLEWRQRHKTLLILWRRPSTQAVLGSFRRHCQFIYSHAEKIGVDEAVVVEVLRQLGFEPPTAEVLPPPEHRIWIPLVSTGPRTVHAYACFGKSETVQPWEYQSRPLGAEDVEIKILHCGICGPDLHMMDCGWKSTRNPCVVGHEIVGEVTLAGSDVKGLKVGDPTDNITNLSSIPSSPTL